MSQDRRATRRIVLYRAEEPGEPELHEVEYDSVSDALHFACRDLRTGRRRPLEILESGALVYDAEQIEAECARNPVADALDEILEQNPGRPAD